VYSHSIVGLQVTPRKEGDTSVQSVQSDTKQEARPNSTRPSTTGNPLAEAFGRQRHTPSKEKPFYRLRDPLPRTRSSKDSIQDNVGTDFSSAQNPRTRPLEKKTITERYIVRGDRSEREINRDPDEPVVVRNYRVEGDDRSEINYRMRRDDPQDTPPNYGYDREVYKSDRKGSPKSNLLAGIWGVVNATLSGDGRRRSPRGSLSFSSDDELYERRDKVSPPANYISEPSKSSGSQNWIPTTRAELDKVRRPLLPCADVEPTLPRRGGDYEPIRYERRSSLNTYPVVVVRGDPYAPREWFNDEEYYRRENRPRESFGDEQHSVASDYVDSERDIKRERCRNPRSKRYAAERALAGAGVAALCTNRSAEIIREQR
jgi:hypothetical protein